MDKLEQGEVRFSVLGEEYKAILDIAALEAVQSAYDINAFEYMDSILPQHDFPKIRELMKVILLSNGFKSDQLPDFTRCTYQGLMGLIGKLTVASLGVQEVVEETEKKPAARARKTTKKAAAD